MIAGAIVVRGNYDLLSPPVPLSGHLSVQCSKVHVNEWRRRCTDDECHKVTNHKAVLASLPVADSKFLYIDDMANKLSDSHHHRSEMHINTLWVCWSMCVTIFCELVGFSTIVCNSKGDVEWMLEDDECLIVTDHIISVGWDWAGSYIAANVTYLVNISAESIFEKDY